jgi:hypothetical protein
MSTGDQFSLTLKNESTTPNLSLAVYTAVPSVTNMSSLLPLAWLVKRVNTNNSITYRWTLDYALMFGTQGVEAGAVWSETGTVNVNDNSTAQNTATLGYPNGDYTLTLTPGANPVKPGYVYLNTTGQVPPYSTVSGPSVALAIATGDSNTPTPAVAGPSGPNLQHMFDLHPTYYIAAGNIIQGTMADMDTVTKMQKVEYKSGVYAAAWTLNDQNVWVPGKVPALAR